MSDQQPQQPVLDIREGYKEKFGFHDDIAPIFKSRKGLDKDVGLLVVCGPQGEPRVIHVETEGGEPHVTVLAPDFASFAEALVACPE